MTVVDTYVSWDRTRRCNVIWIIHSAGMLITLPEVSQEFPGIMLLQMLYSLTLLQGLIQRHCLLEESGREHSPSKILLMLRCN